MSREKLVLVSDDYTITKEMIETNEMNESLRPNQVVNRLLRYFIFEEHLVFEKSVEKIEKFLEDNELHYKDGHITELCEEYSKQTSFKPLKRLDPIKLYESDIEVINSLPNQDTKKTYLTMMVKCKTNRMLGVKEENINVLFNEFYQYTSYCSRTNRTDSNEVLKYLQQNGLIDVPLFELDRMYYTAPQESGEVVCELDPTKLDGDGLLQQFYAIFGKGCKPKKVEPVKEEEYYMIIDLMKPFGREVKKGIKEVREYLVSEGVKKGTAKSTAIQNIVDHKKYMLQDFTIVKIDNYEDVKYLMNVEILQRSVLDCSRKVCTTVPGLYFEYIFSYGVLSQVKNADMDWNSITKTIKDRKKEMKKDGIEDMTVDVLKHLKGQK